MASRSRDRIVAAAARWAAEEDWSRLTMSGLARSAGVSRQTLYNEVGSKAGLTEVLALHELELFLELVEKAVGDHPESVVAAARAAAYAVLSRAPDASVLQQILAKSQVDGAHGRSGPTSNAFLLVEAATAVVARQLARYPVALTGGELSVAAETLVRLVLSQASHPTASPMQAADDVAWVAARLLATVPSRASRAAR
ncbi:MAG: TetR family transcriptional regulator [Nocardioides sp.]|uniref:TetR family transcriptional regulator n=1 Tax=Nocardioides sp. TaxID=35761 RepID=UPI0039E700E9